MTDTYRNCRDLGDSWINGNRQSVLEECESAHPALALRVFTYLDGYGHQAALDFYAALTKREKPEPGPGEVPRNTRLREFWEVAVGQYFWLRQPGSRTGRCLKLGPSHYRHGDDGMHYAEAEREVLVAD